MTRIHRRTILKKGLNESDNHNGVLTHLEPDILECEVKWDLGRFTMEKASGGMLYQITHTYLSVLMG